MKRSQLLLALFGMFVFPLTVGEGSAFAQPSRMWQVYDIDYGGNPGARTQVGLLQGNDTSLIASTDNEQVQRVAETALQSAMKVTIAYSPAAQSPYPIERITLFASGCAFATGTDPQYCVVQVSCEAVGDKCTAALDNRNGKRTNARIDNPRALGVLLTAVSRKKPVEYLSLDGQGTITRVKINVPGARHNVR